MLSRTSFNGFCPTATGYVAMGQIKIYGGAGAGLGARPCTGPKIYGILKFDELRIFSVFSNVNGISDDFCWFSGEK